MTGLSTHPWMGGLLGDPEIASCFAPGAELQRYLKIEAAWTRALGRATNQPQAEAIAQTIENAVIDVEVLKDGFSKDGVAIPALVTALKAMLSPDDRALVHNGLTSQDVTDTALMLALIDVLAILTKRLDHLDEILRDMKARFGSAKLMAFTRMQPALETTVVAALERWRQPIAELQSELARAIKQCHRVQWGGPIGARDHEDAAHLGTAFAAQLGLTDPGAAWHTDRSTVLFVAHLLTRIAVTTGKIGKDIALMAALGPKQITLSGGGSSAMAHKNNPIIAEALVSLSSHAAALQMSLSNAAVHEGFRSGQAWTQEWLALPQLCESTGAGLLQAMSLLESVKSLGQQ